MDSHNSQCEILEHQIDNTELFHDPYPYEEFERYQLPNLEKESLKFYKEQLKFAGNDKALAYYFFEYRNLSKDVKAGIWTVYKQFTEKYTVKPFVQSPPKRPRSIQFWQGGTGQRVLVF